MVGFGKVVVVVVVVVASVALSSTTLVGFLDSAGWRDEGGSPIAV